LRREWADFSRRAPRGGPIVSASIPPAAPSAPAMPRPLASRSIRVMFDTCRRLELPPRNGPAFWARPRLIPGLGFFATCWYNPPAVETRSRAPCKGPLSFVSSGWSDQSRRSITSRSSILKTSTRRCGRCGMPRWRCRRSSTVAIIGVTKPLRLRGVPPRRGWHRSERPSNSSGENIVTSGRRSARRGSEASPASATCSRWPTGWASTFACTATRGRRRRFGRRGWRGSSTPNFESDRATGRSDRLAPVADSLDFPRDLVNSKTGEFRRLTPAVRFT